MLLTKRFSARVRIANLIVVRPRRHDRDPFRINSLGDYSLFHETIEHDRVRRMMKTVVQHSLQQLSRNRVALEPACRNRFVRVKVHHPETEASTFKFHEERGEK